MLLVIIVLPLISTEPSIQSLKKYLFQKKIKEEVSALSAEPDS